MVAITFLDLAAIVLASTALVETLGGRTLIRPFHTRLLLVSPWRPMLYGAGLLVLRILFARRVPPRPAREAVVERLTHLGFEVRVQLELNDGHSLWSQITRDDLERLGLKQQQRVYVEPRRAHVFAEAAHG